MQQATLAQSVEQRIRNAQVVSSSLMSGSKKGKYIRYFPFFEHVLPYFEPLSKHYYQISHY